MQTQTVLVTVGGPCDYTQHGKVLARAERFGDASDVVQSSIEVKFTLEMRCTITIAEIENSLKDLVNDQCSYTVDIEPQDTGETHVQKSA